MIGISSSSGVFRLFCLRNVEGGGGRGDGSKKYFLTKGAWKRTWLRFSIRLGLGMKAL